MRPITLTTILIFFAFSQNADALQITKRSIRNQGIFGIKVANTDMGFYGRADAILSISFQEYTTGAFIVSEVVIDMKDSNQQLRIYNTRPPGTEDVANRANRASAANSENRGLDPKTASKLPIPTPLASVETKVNTMLKSTTGDIVVKSYPATTHAKTVEIKVTSKEELKSLYSNLINLFTGFEVDAIEGSSVGTPNSVPATTTTANALTGNGAAPKAKINQIGGVLFTLE